MEAPELPTTLPGGFILEDFEEEEIGDTIEVLPPSLPERPPETSKERSAAPAPALPTPRATVSPEPAPSAAGSAPPVAGSAPPAGSAPAEPAQPSEISTVLKPTREIFGDPEDPRNII